MNELEIIKNPQIFLKNEIVLYGAGKYNTQFLEKVEGLNLNIRYICDKKDEMWGKKKKGIEIVSPKQLRKVQSIIIITSSYYSDILEELENMGITEEVYTDFAVGLSIHLNIDNGIFNHAFVSKYKRDFYLESMNAKMKQGHQFAYGLYVKFWSDIIKYNPILIYQVGKVGSSTLYKSVAESGIQVLQPHALAFRPEYMDAEFRNLYDMFQREIDGFEKIKIITVVRDPIGRDLAHIFEHFYTLSLDFYSELEPDLCKGVVNIINKYILNASKLEEWSQFSPWMIHHLLRLAGEQGAMLDWFDKELKPVFGVDIFDYAFDREQGYGLINKGNIEVMVIKLEKMDELCDIIGDFLEIKDFKLSRKNESRSKDYYFTYKELLEKIILPKEYVNLYYDNPKIRHFYTDDEIVRMKRKWRVY